MPIRCFPQGFNDMADESTTFEAAKTLVRAFAAERRWEPFHTPKNLCMALAAEVGELMEHFLWLTGEESVRALEDPARREAIADELADVATLVLHLSTCMGIDLSGAIEKKMVKNAVKYPPPTDDGDVSPDPRRGH